MDWKHTFNAFYNWETEDTFIPTGNKYLSSFGIDPSKNPRYLQLSDALTNVWAFTTLDEITDIVSLPSSNYVHLWSSNVFYNSTDRVGVIAWTGYCKAGFLYNTSSALKVYVLDQTNVYRMDATLAVKEATTAHAWWVVTAITQATNTLVYAIKNVLYQINNAWAISTALSDIPYGSVVKNIYFYNDFLYVFTQLWSDVIIYQCTYNGNTYTLRYTHTKEDISLYDMAWSGWKMYWIGSTGIYQTDGLDSKKIQKNAFTSASRCSIYRDDFLYIIDWVNVYRYGTDLTWFPTPFVKYVNTTTTVAINWIYLFGSRSGWSSILYTYGWYVTTGEIVTIPYDAWALWAEKTLEVIAFSYELAAWKTWASIQIQCQTNLMELNNSVNYVNILTITDLSNSIMRARIDMSEILTALWNNNPDWNYIRFKIILNKGSTAYTPKVYQDIFIWGSFTHDKALIW